MTRTTWTLAFLFVSLFTAGTKAADLDTQDPHIRSTEPELLSAMRDGARRSPTLQRLVTRLEASDVVVYLMFDRAPERYVAGHISILAAVPGRRYLRVSIDRHTIGCERIAILAHELHHALEISESASVTDEAGLAALYRRIGFRSAQGHGDCFDSSGAILAGQLVRREILGRYTELTRFPR